MSDYNYIIVLFKNKVRKKIVKTFKTSNRCSKFYEKMLSESDKIIFNKEYDNGFSSKYELGLMERKNEILFPVPLS